MISAGRNFKTVLNLILVDNRLFIINYRRKKKYPSAQRVERHQLVGVLHGHFIIFPSCKCNQSSAQRSGFHLIAPYTYISNSRKGLAITHCSNVLCYVRLLATVETKDNKSMQKHFKTITTTLTSKSRKYFLDHYYLKLQQQKQA